MEVAVHGRRVEVDDGLRESAARKVTKLSRYLSGVERAEVTFTDGEGPGAPVSCEVTLEGRGRVVRASARSTRAASALDEAVDRATHRLVRVKKKLIDRSRPRHASSRGASGEAAGAEEGAER